MSNLWERFNGITNAEEVVEAKTQFTPIAEGEYTAVLEKMVADQTQGGFPRLATQFRTDSNRVVFFNITLQNPSYPDMTRVNVANALALVEAVRGEVIDFQNIGQLADIIGSTAVGGRYKIKVSYSAKHKEAGNFKYPKVTILESLDNAPVVDDEDVPF